MEENKGTYLQIIQEPICRMSTISSILKGFCATIVISAAGINYYEVDIAVLALLFIPVLSFAALDVYYLRLERQFRYLYKQVQEGKHKCDFSLDFVNPQTIEEAKLAKTRIVDCILSNSIWPFYSLMVVMLVLIAGLSCKGVI